MWIFVIAAFLITSVALAARYDEHMSEALPVTTGMLILILYFLAFFRALSFIDIIASIIILLSGAFFLGKSRSGRKETFSVFCQKLFSPETIILLAITALALICEKDRIFTWWDDINFWATDTRSLYYLNGFAGKYGNVAPEFGDYPPGIQLFKWLFLHISPDNYIEGLQFAGYYVMNMIFLLPLVRSVASAVAVGIGRKQSRVISALCHIAAAAIVFMIPGIMDGMHFGGTCADITMGILYGALLYAMWDRNGHSETFYLLRICIYTCILIMTKSVGIEWAAFALIFWLTVCKYRSKKVFLPVLCAAAAEGSWLTFCLLMRRVAKLTSAGLHMAGSSYQLPDDAGAKLTAFIKAFTGISMHSDSNITFDLSPAAMLLILMLIPVLFILTGAFSRKKMLFLELYLMLTAAGSYGVIFLAHITVFRGETQYLDPANMALSISRYGAPFTLGTFCLLTGMISRNTAIEIRNQYMEHRNFNNNGINNNDINNNGINNNDIKNNYIKNNYINNNDIGNHDCKNQDIKNHCRRESVLVIGFIIFILLTADYSGMKKALYGYRNTLLSDSSYKESMIDQEGKKFIELANGSSEMERLAGHRALYLRDPQVIHWVKDTYISSEVSPAAVVYGDLRPSDKVEYAQQLINASHADYLYVEEQSPELKELLEEATGIEGFTFGKIYYVGGK